MKKVNLTIINQAYIWKIASNEKHSPKEIPLITIKTENDTLKLKNTEKGKKRKNNCGHIERKHYAKGMCSICYHKAGRTKPAWKCKHTDKPNYARGCWQSCYLSLYYKNNRSMKY